jgi:four helix bundle protein
VGFQLPECWSNGKSGVMELWSIGVMEVRKNKNRGYQKLRVWNDAIEYYVKTCQCFRKFRYDLRRIAAQAVASADSVHRNIAEGYCRSSINEYLNFLNIALGSLGESISGLHAYRKAEQLAEEDFENLDSIGYKLENGLLKLVESLEEKREQGDWIDHLIIKESNALYGNG